MVWTTDLNHILKDEVDTLDKAYCRQGEMRLIDSDQDTDEDINDLGVAKCL